MSAPRFDSSLGLHQNRMLQYSAENCSARCFALPRESSMKRRKFLKQIAAGGLFAGVVASPAIAQSHPSIRWRLAASWPKSLDTLFGSADELCRRVAQLTEKKFEIQAFAGGEIVPPLQVLDATQNGTVECCHTLTAFYIGKNPAYAFDSGLAFGLNNRQQNAWLY